MKFIQNADGTKRIDLEIKWYQRVKWRVEGWLSDLHLWLNVPYRKQCQRTYQLEQWLLDNHICDMCGKPMDQCTMWIDLLSNSDQQRSNPSSKSEPNK